jgi:uncharacterized membrane protein YbaN (DUF454 family)
MVKRMAVRLAGSAWVGAVKRGLGRAVTPLLLVLGWSFLALGIAGIFLPLLPGTVFLILSAACFSRSSPRFERWLLEHPHLGPPVRQWRQTGSIRRPIKVIACLSIAVSWLILLATDAPPEAKIAMLAVLCGVAFYIVSRPER